MVVLVGRGKVHSIRMTLTDGVDDGRDDASSHYADLSSGISADGDIVAVF